MTDIDTKELLGGMRWMTEEQLGEPVTLKSVIKEFARIGCGSYYGDAVEDGLNIIIRLKAHVIRLEAENKALLKAAERPTEGELLEERWNDITEVYAQADRLRAAAYGKPVKENNDE